MLKSLEPLDKVDKPKLELEGPASPSTVGKPIPSVTPNLPPNSTI